MILLQDKLLSFFKSTFDQNDITYLILEGNRNANAIHYIIPEPSNQYTFSSKVTYKSSVAYVTFLSEIGEITVTFSSHTNEDENHIYFKYLDEIKKQFHSWCNKEYTNKGRYLLDLINCFKKKY